jgi:antitoxin Xre/MbcA/ParS-like protein
MTAIPNPRIAGVALDRPADLSSRKIQETLSPSALLGFFQIAALWKLRDEDARGLLGGISNGAFYNLKRRPARTLDQDKLTRISLLVGIFKALNILYSGKLADAWVQLPNANPMFGGESPLACMIKGGVPAMIRVRQLLDARRGGR